MPNQTESHQIWFKKYQDIFLYLIVAKDSVTWARWRDWHIYPEAENWFTDHIIIIWILAIFQVISLQCDLFHFCPQVFTWHLRRNKHGRNRKEENVNIDRENKMVDLSIMSWICHPPTIHSVNTFCYARNSVNTLNQTTSLSEITEMEKKNIVNVC